MSDKEDKQEVTLTELAAEMRSGFTALRQEMRGGFTALRDEISGVREYARQGFETMSEKVDEVDKNMTETMVTKLYLDTRLEKIEAGMFTEDQKKSMLDTMTLVNNQLEANVLGKESITLTRSEYDALIDAVQLPNRFVGHGTVEVD